MYKDIRSMLGAVYTSLGFHDLHEDDAEASREYFTLNLNAKVYFENKVAYVNSPPIFDCINTVIVDRMGTVRFSFETASSCCGIQGYVLEELTLDSCLPDDLKVVIF
jgi:hypothetical protein